MVFFQNPLISPKIKKSHEIADFHKNDGEVGDSIFLVTFLKWRRPRLQTPSPTLRLSNLHVFPFVGRRSRNRTSTMSTLTNWQRIFLPHIFEYYPKQLRHYYSKKELCQFFFDYLENLTIFVTLWFKMFSNFLTISLENAYALL